MERLTGETFKVYITLTLNKDGYVYKNPLTKQVIDELKTQGYLIDGEFFEEPLELIKDNTPQHQNPIEKNNNIGEINTIPEYDEVPF